jgi:predicted transposase YbfD/YdcC
MIFQSNNSNSQKEALQKGQWTIEEDNILLDWIQSHGPKRWTLCSKLLKCRSPKQIRDRWINTLSPNIKKGEWSIAEDYIIFKLFKEIGSKWNFMCNYLSSRSGNSIKNRFYSTLRRHALGNVKKYNITSELIIKMKTKDLLTYLPEAHIEKTIKIDEVINKYNNNGMINFKKYNSEKEDDISNKFFIVNSKNILKDNQDYQNQQRNRNKNKKMIREKGILEKMPIFNIEYLNEILLKENLLPPSSNYHINHHISLQIKNEMNENKEMEEDNVLSYKEDNNQWYEYLGNKRKFEINEDFRTNDEIYKTYDNYVSLLDMKNSLDYHDLYDRNQSIDQLNLLVDELNEIEKKFLDIIPKNNVFELYTY